MPEMAAGRRGSGPHRPREDDDRPPLRVPDQSRYGPAPSGTKLTRAPRAPRWRLWVVDSKGHELHNAVVIGEAAMMSELAEFEARADVAAAVALPI